MAKAAKTSDGRPRRRRAAITPEARESQLISLAMDLAEQQLLDGTASSQIITEFLKRGSERARIEKELLEKQRDLASAKADSIKSQANLNEMYVEAMAALKSYKGETDEEEWDDGY